MCYKIVFSVLFAFIFGASQVFGQAGCISSTGAVYGSPNSDERGYCVVSTQGGDGAYVAGFKDDSILLLRVNLEGVILWVKTFDIVPGKEEHVYSMIMDSEGMLAAVGTAGDEILGDTDIAFRFNPNTQQILWAHEYEGVLPRNYGQVIVQIGSGNFIIANNTVMANLQNDVELLWLNKTTGAIIPGFSRNYHLGGSERWNDAVFYNNFIYAVGRYTDGEPYEKMRHTLVKLDPTTGTHVWAKLGHLDGNGTARLYGEDIVIEQNEIYSIYYGDPSGITTLNTKVWVQKSSIDGNLLWLKQYELPGVTDFAYEIIKSGNGLVLFVQRKSSPVEMYLVKINFNGDLLWSKKYTWTTISSPLARSGTAQLAEVGNTLMFTGYGTGTGGSPDLILARTDLNGESITPCMSAQNVVVTVQNVPGPVFYDEAITEFGVTLVDNNESPDIIDTELDPTCTVIDTLYSFINETICLGEIYEGYSVAGTYIDNFTTTEGCDSIRTLNLGVIPPESTTENVTICLGASYNGFTTSGVYTGTFQNTQGCDSVHTLFLNVDPLEIDLAVQICEGQDYEGYTAEGFYTDTIQGPPNDCDTIRHLALSVTPPEESFVDETICEGESYEGYTTTGFYVDVFQNAFGCDSIRTLDLTVEEADETEEEVTICEGQSYNGHTQTGIYSATFQNVFGCDSIYTLNLEVVPFELDVITSLCEGESYQGYTETGFYTDLLPGIAGECDTTRYLDLTVHPQEETFIEISICDGDEYEGYTSTGVYTDQFVTIYGCDSIRHLDLVVAVEITTYYNIIICPGDSYEGYTTPGIYEDEFISVFGCDSIRTLELDFGSPETFRQVSICANDNYLGYTTSGQYVDTLNGTSGDCDTILYLNLEVLPPEEIAIDQTICAGDSYLGYTISGAYTDTLQNANGCDSLRLLNLSVVDELTTSASVQICQGQSYEGYEDDGIYIDRFTSVFGCDSIRTLTISFTPPLLTYINAGVCAGQTFLGYSQTGMYSDTFQTIDGCDSVRMLNLTVDSEIIFDETISICFGQSYQGYSGEGFYTDTFTSAFGCDSIRHLDLTIDTPQNTESVSICEGTSYLGYTQPGTYVDTLPGAAGACDTINTLFLTLTAAFESDIVKSICDGQSFGGYTTNGVYVDTFQTSEGCDSIRTLHLTVDDFIVASFDIQICSGDAFEGYTEPGFYADTFPTAFGCDSIRQLNLGIVNPETIITVEICAGQNFGPFSQSGIYQDTLPGVGPNCDTTRKIFLTVLPAATSVIEQAICEGEIYEGYAQPGNYIDTLTTLQGCDSVRSLALTVDEPVRNSITASICDQLLTEYSQPGVYIDTLISVRGCDSIQEFIIEEASLFIPNVFSPNDDGINDVFTVMPFPATELTIDYFAIFDRFGDMVYETDEWPVHWTGTDYKGKKFQPAVFAYVLMYKCTDETRIQHGNITLLK